MPIVIGRNDPIGRLREMEKKYSIAELQSGFGALLRTVVENRPAQTSTRKPQREIKKKKADQSKKDDKPVHFHAPRGRTTACGRRKWRTLKTTNRRGSTTCQKCLSRMAEEK